VDQQVVLITGASRGFGAAAARKIASRGHVVIATMRDPSRDGPAVRAGFEDLIEAVRLDVTDAAEVEQVVAAALERHGHVDVVVNNAGYGVYGPAECGSEAQLWSQLDTNTFGPLRVIRAVLPSMRARRRGKIVNVTSLSGRIVSPLLAHYAATKHALEALTEGLRFEVGALGIQVCNLEPGMFASDWQTGNLDIAEGATDGPYAELVATRLGAFRELAATRPGSASVAAALADIVELQQPLPLRWPVGNDAVHQIPIRSTVSDEEWAQLCRTGTFGPWRAPLHPSAPAPAPHAWSGENVVLVTGGSRGFGAAAARELASRGNQIVATMRDPDRDAKAVVEGYEDSIHPVRLDVNDSAATAACVAETIRRFGRLDALVNNAGYGLFGAQEDLSDDETRRQFDTNLVGQWRMVRAAAPQLRQQGYGKIVNVSSLSGRVPSPLLSCYAATKHAVEAMSEGLAAELAAWGVQVTILEPGMYASDWQTTNLDVCESVRTGASAYGRATERAIAGFRALAATRPGSDAVAAAIADIVQLQQPLPLRWPVGEDCLRMIADRRRSSDDEWEARMRAAGWGFRPEEVENP
jgi:NAD(P)-dependent dehydrogenase (short-subunit alcohol dehydrogenase family)